MKFEHHLRALTDDLGFAARSLSRTFVFAGTTVVSLALGIALAASTLSVMNSYVIRALPFPASERLYRAIYDSPGQPEPRGVDRVDWTSLSDVIEVADYSGLGRFVLHTDNYPQEISSLLCAPGALEAIGVRATLGRAFSPGDYRTGAERVIMIGDAFWRSRFGASPTVLGQTVRVSRANSGDAPLDYRIIGVLPAGFRYVGNYFREPADTALPFTTVRQAYMVRLREGIPPTIAAQRISEAVRSVATGIPSGWRGVRLESVHAHYVREARPVLVGVTVAAALVLLIVVTNIAVLMLLRALRRQKEIAIRAALGAEPYRIARLLLAEAALICGSAIALGVALTAIMLRSLGPQIQDRLGLAVPGGVPALAMDRTVLLWIGGLGLLITVIVAWLPMIAERPLRLIDSLRGDGRGGTDRPVVRRVRAVLVTLEIAVSTALLIGGGLMVRTVVHLSDTDLGYETSQIFRPRIQLPNATYGNASSFVRFYDRLEDRLAAIPNLSFALSTFVPFWEPPAQPVEASDHSQLRSSITAAGAGYFRTLGIGVREGRTFTPSDRAGSEPVVVLSESLARRLAPHGSALGFRVRTTESSVSGDPLVVSRTVVGVVHDVHQTPADVDLLDAYVPFAQAPSRFSSVYMRASGSSEHWLETLRTVVASIDPDVFVGPSPPLSVQAADLLAGPRFVTALLSVFALFAGLLALLGIYAVTAYGVQQREREIAVRMAIGATTGAVIRMFLRHSGKLLLAGIAAGVFAGSAVSRILQNQLHGVERLDPLTLGATAILLATAGLLATWLPARSVARTDPIAVLRAE